MVFPITTTSTFHQIQLNIRGWLLFHFVANAQSSFHNHSGISRKERMQCSVRVHMELSPSVRYRGSTAPAEETEPPSPKWTQPDTSARFCALTLNIGGRNTNPMEFVLEGDDSDVGAESTALTGKLFEAMTSDTAGPQALGAAERAAVDS